MSDALTKKKRIYLCLDIEKAGCRYDNPLLAVGMCLGSLENGVLGKRTWCCKPLKGQEWEPRCIYEFWAQYPKILERITKDARPLEEQIESIEWFLASLQIKYPEETHQIIIVSDNPSFDIEHFDHYYCSITGKPPLRNRGSKMYLCVEDCSERLEALDLWETQQVVLKDVAVHDHWPENDAEKIFWQHVVSLGGSSLLKQGLALEQIKAKFSQLLKVPPLKSVNDESYALEDGLLRLARGLPDVPKSPVEEKKKKRKGNSAESQQWPSKRLYSNKKG